MDKNNKENKTTMPDDEGDTMAESGTDREKALYTPLLTKVYDNSKEQLENAIAEQLLGPHRALNRQAAMQRLVREKGRRELPDTVDAIGRYLQTYQRVPREGSTEEPGISVYLANKGGVKTIHGANKDAFPSAKGAGLTKIFGERQKWSGLTQVENVLYSTISLRSVRGQTKIAPATVAEAGPKLWDVANDITMIKDGQGVWRGWVATIFKVGTFDQKTRQRTGSLPILDNHGAAHLSVGLTDEIDRKTGRAPVGKKALYVEITSEAQLRTFLGNYFSEETLMGDNAAQELADALTGQPVIVFGSGRTPQAENQRRPVTEPRIKMYGGNGTISPWVPEQD